MKPKILVIVGPTATGKSDLAVELARQYNGEIISADSRQVYKGLDIGSGKITKREMRGVPHYLLDVVNPTRVFSVADFKRLGRKAIDTILARGKLPIIVGGTGFYIDALVYNMSIPAVAENKKLRKELDKKSTEELFTLLEKQDPERAMDIDRHNKVRLIRALEIIDTLGNIPKIEKEELFDVCWIGLTWPDDVLKERIHTRLLARMKRGMVAEANRLHTQGVSWKRMEALGLEYRYLAQLLQKKITREMMLAEIKTKSWQYAKRQKTWLKRNKEITWIVPTRTSEIQNTVMHWLRA